MAGSASSPAALPEIFISFPVKDRITLAAGDTELDFIGGAATLPDGTTRPLSRKSSAARPLRYVRFSTNQDINVEISYAGEVQYAGPIPAGDTDLANVTFDNIIITTSTATGMHVVASTSPDTVTWQRGLPVKSPVTTLRPVTAVAADAQSLSAELDINLIERVNLFIDHARDDGNAFVGAGTEYRVLVSSAESGNEGWSPLYSVVCGITAPTSMVMDAAEAAGQTVIECGAAVPALGQYVFFKNSILGRSEWGKVTARSTVGGSESVTLMHGLTYAQAAATIYDQGEKFVLSLNVKGYKRLKVVCNNNNGTTNRAIVWRCRAITQRW